MKRDHGATYRPMDKTGHPFRSGIGPIPYLKHMFKTPSHAMVVAVGWNYKIHPLNKGLVPFATLGLRSMRMHYFGHAARINNWS